MMNTFLIHNSEFIIMITDVVQGLNANQEVNYELRE